MVSIWSLQARPVEEREVGAPPRDEGGYLGEQQSVVAYDDRRCEAGWRHRRIPSPAAKHFAPPLIAVRKKWPASGRPFWRSFFSDAV